MGGRADRGTVKLAVRPAEPADVPTLIELHDRHYGGGYAACFDRYGPARPQDFWWVQSEKSVSLLEVDGAPAGFLVIGRSGKRLLAEEVILDRLPPRSDEERVYRQLHDYLTARFQEERQDRLTVRGDETNAAVLGCARQYGFTLANALVVAAGGMPGPGLPEGYQVRRARPEEARHIARLHEETLETAVRPRDLEAMWKTDARVFVAERERYAVGFVLAQVRDGVGRWTAGVREPHRSRGIGAALVRHALTFFHSKGVPAVTTYWAADPAAARFARAIGARTERVYLYFERPL